jgi:pepF/M3 family oligoendopeptidase
MQNWCLKDLYQGFNEDYEADLTKLTELVNQYKRIVIERDQLSFKEVVEKYLINYNQLIPLVRNLSSYASLINAIDLGNAQALQSLAKIKNIMNTLTIESILFSRYLVSIDLENLALESKLINEFLTLLLDQQNDARYLLTEKEEALYAKLTQVSSSGWSLLHDLTTANLDVKFKGQEITFSDLRNLAYDADLEVRKQAYQLELKCYQQIEDYVALALSNIKREVTVLNKLRGYDSVLQKTLNQSRMSNETLTAMISAMESYKPYFEQYLQAKAKYLGHKNSLPFYDLFAPVGSLDKEYIYEEGCKVVLDAFKDYSNSLYDYTKKAIDSNWIDIYSKKGKSGGAFCANLPQIKQSRIMLNYSSSLGDVMTLAHELGHGYHGSIIQQNQPMHWSYPMPLAETASIFCETLVKEYLLKEFTKKEERLYILENALQGETQVIVDILSRFYFESKVFEVSDAPISKDEFNQYMTDAQIKAYGSGLDEKHLHPYMWLVKGHYYSAGLNFYNFPYAFGLLFGKGLYAQYQKDAKKFVKDYDKLLSLTGKEHAETVAKSMNIDITDQEFWINSLELIKKDILEVINLMEGK